MVRIKHYIEANINGCGCNLQCSYCYLRQAKYNQTRTDSCLNYTLEVIQQACSIRRLGGSCLFNLVGDGETLLPKEIVDLIEVLVQEGHYVNVLTNGTISDRMRELVERLQGIGKADHICFHLSLHYVELKRKKLLKKFFENVKYVQSQGISFHIKTVLGREFNEELAKELRTICKEEIGAYPQVGIARQDNPDGTFSICTEMGIDEYFRMGDKFESQMFELDKKEFNKKRDEFCYAGKWCFMLNLTTGSCWECLSNASNSFNFYENIYELPLEAVGKRCNRNYCSCTNFQAWGVMPEHDECTNLEVFDRPEANWIKEPFRTILNSKLYETNSEYTELEKIWSYEKSVSKDILKQKRDLIAKQIEKKDWENVVITIDDVVRSDLFNLKEKWMKQMIIMYGYALFFSQSYQNVSSVYADFYEEFNNSTEYLLLLGKLYVKEEMLEKAIVIFHRVKELSTDEKEKENADQYIRALEEKVQ